MVGTWTFDPINKILTVTGGTSGAPVTFQDALVADKAGTRTLLAATASPFTMSLTTNVKPAESLALKLSVVLTNFSVAGTVTLTGKDAWGNAISEAINITGNGTFISTLFYASVDANGVVAAGTFTAAITQPRWGVVYGFGYYNAGGWGHPGYAQYLFEARLQIGDGTTSTYFADESRNITFNHYLFGGNAIYVTNNATFVLGRILTESKKTTYAGCSIIGLCDDGQDLPITGATGSTMYFYSSHFIKHRYNYYSLAQAVSIGGTPTAARVWNCRGNFCFQQNIRNFDVYNIETRAPGRGIINQPSTGNTYDKVNVFSNTYVYTSDMYRNVTISNVYARDCNYVFSPTNNGNYSHYLIDADIDIWAFNWGATEGKIYRQYHLDLKVRDKNGDPIENALVRLLDNTSAELFSVQTDENGDIAQQLIDYGYYTRILGNTMHAFGAFTLQITNTGKMPYSGSIDMDRKTSLIITLRDQLSGTADAYDVIGGATFYKDDADSKLTGTHENPGVFIDIGSGKPVLNLNRKKLDNQLILGL